MPSSHPALRGARRRRRETRDGLESGDRPIPLGDAARRPVPRRLGWSRRPAEDADELQLGHGRGGAATSEAAPEGLPGLHPVSAARETPGDESSPGDEPRSRPPRACGVALRGRRIRWEGACAPVPQTQPGQPRRRRPPPAPQREGADLLYRCRERAQWEHKAARSSVASRWASSPGVSRPLTQRAAGESLRAWRADRVRLDTGRARS